MEEYKFHKSQAYQLGLAYVDAVYELSRKLPERERFNLSSQIERATTSIILNIAEGSTRSIGCGTKSVSWTCFAFLSGNHCLL